MWGLDTFSDQNLPDQLIRQGKLKDLKSLVLTRAFDVRRWKDRGNSWSLLHVAAASNQAEIIQYLASGIYSINVNTRDKQGNTALHVAVLHNCKEAVKALLELKTDDTIQNEDFNPALHLALQLGSKGHQLVKDFLSFPNVDVFVHGRHGQTALHVLAKLDDVDMFAIIHDCACSRKLKANVMAKDSNGVTIIHTTARAGAQKMMSFLFKTTQEYSICPKDLANMPTYDHRVPLHYAVENNRVECIRLLLLHEADCTTRGGNLRPPIHLASAQDSMNILKLMVETKGADILQARDSSGGTLLHSSVSSINSKVIIPYLIKNGVGVNEADVNGLTPLANAIQLGSLIAMETLLDCGADPLIKNKEGRNALHLVMLGKRGKLCGRIMQSDAVEEMIHAPDKYHMLPIQYALKLGLSQIVETLPLDASIEDDSGNNCLHLAVLSEDIETVLMVLDLPASQFMLNDANLNGLTPLHFAAMGCNVAIVQKLVDFGAIIHKCNKGLTPFMLACSKGHLESASLLFSTNKFQKNWVDLEENSGLHWAVSGKNPSVITFCLDQHIPVTLNSDGLSFFDKILQNADRSLAQATILHDRWEECLDIVSVNLPHPLLRILDAVPEVYGKLLDQCFLRSDLDPTHNDYWEEFNFRGVTICSVENLSGGSGSMDGTNYSPTEDDASPHAFSFDVHSDIGLNEEELVNVRQNALQTTEDPQSSWQHVVKRKKPSNSLEVIRELIKRKRELYLLHPVVEAFIQSKWSGFGKYYYFTTFGLQILLAVLLSIFVSIIPLPLQFLEVQNQTVAGGNGSCCTEEPLSTGAAVLLYFTLILSIVNSLLFFGEALSHRLDLLLHFNQHAVIFLSFCESVCSIIFLSSILHSGVNAALWNAAAIAVCLSWLSVGFQMQLLRALNIGVYITIFMSTTRLVIKVLLIMFFFVLAFAIPLHILVGSQSELQFTTAGISIFAMVHTLIAVTDYLGFIRLEQQNELRFSTLTFMFLVVIIIILPIVIVNILIGLAVGDIARIQQEAVITRRTVEVRSLAHLDNLKLPEWMAKRIGKLRHRHYPNRHSLLMRGINFVKNKLIDESIGRKWDDESVEVVMRNLITEENKRIRKRMKKLENQMEEQLEGIRRIEAHVEATNNSESATKERLEYLITKLSNTQYAEA